MGRALWLPDRIRSYGVDVREVDGWRERGAEPGNFEVIVAHHTANPNKASDMPSLGMLINGRSGLPGPLCNLGLSRSGICYVVAAGRANHAGAGGWNGVTGNSRSLGIEAENDGVGEPWSPAMLDAYVRIEAALCDGTSPMRGAEWVCAHREWAPSRKIDPRGIDMGWMRAAVAQRRAEHHTGQRPAPPPGPAPAPAHIHDLPLTKLADDGPDRGRVHGAVRRPNGTWVWQVNYQQRFWEIADIQQHMRNQGHDASLSVDGIGGPTTLRHLLAYQRHRGGDKAADGVVGPQTWRWLHG